MDSEKKYLLSTLWMQYDKVLFCGSNETLDNGIHFNAYTPLDLYLKDVRSVTGCATTAASQIIYYYLQNDFQNDDIACNLTPGILTEQDAYVSFAQLPAFTLYITAEGSEAGGTLSFAEINQKLSVFAPVPTDPSAGDYDLNSLAAADYIAALNFSIGVLHKSTYSNALETAAVFSENVFLRCGFQSASAIFFRDMEEEYLQFWIDENEKITDETIEILIENLEKGAPVAFGIPGHGIVLDGYDKATDMFHLNYGWGREDDPDDDSQEKSPPSTRWYTRQEFKDLGSIGFVIDIAPVYQETFTVTDNRFFGSGTLLRAIQQATAMQGANTITFDDALTQAGAQELQGELKLNDQITLSGFNMTLLADDTATPDGRENEEEDAGENALAVFYGQKGNRTEFTDFRGNVICNYREQTTGAALYFTEAVQLNLSAGNANIFSGVSRSKSAAILQKMQSGSLNKLLADTQRKVAIAGSNGDDRILLDDKSLVIGDLELSGGHDTLTLSGNSRIYGDIHGGRGDNVISLSAGSSIHGNLLGQTELCITLTGSNTDILFEITGDAENTFANITTITIDAAHAEAAEYTLFNKGNLERLLAKLHISGGGGLITAQDGSIRWSTAGSHTSAAAKDEPEKTVIAAGETVTDTAVGADEIWIFQDGSIASGTLEIAGSGEVKVMTGAKFVFDITSMAGANQNGIIRNYSGINGTFLFAVNVAADQANGCYLLAENVAEWDLHTPISVAADGLTIGSFAGGEDDTGFTHGDSHYELVYDAMNQSLNLVIDSAFRTAVSEDNAIELAWHKPAGATGYFVEISRNNAAGAIRLFSETNRLHLVTAADGEYEWQVFAPGLETEYRKGGTFASGAIPEENHPNAVDTDGVSRLYSAGQDDEITDVFIAESSGIWSGTYVARHAALPKNGGANNRIAPVVLNGQNRYSDLFNGAEGDSALLYLSDSENGDALFVDDIYSAFPDAKPCERLSNINQIYAGGGNDIIDLTTGQFQFSGENMRVFGGDGDDVIWADINTPCTLYGDRGNDCLAGSTGEDCFVGGAGDDIMYGLGGTDVFAYGDPETWGNDIIYQLQSQNDIALLHFEQEDLKDKIRAEGIAGGMRISVAGYENCSITFYGMYYNFTFGVDSSKISEILESGGCGEAASETIFENKDNGMLA